MKTTTKTEQTTSYAEVQEGAPFRAVAEFTYDWESWIDTDNRLRWTNAAVERTTGYTVEECRALPDYPLSLVHPADRPAIAALLARAATGESGNHFEFRILRKDGEPRWGAISWQPIVGEQGEALGFRTSVRDIEEHKKMQAQLSEAVKRAEAANHAKTEFLANISHELRTPLHAILGYAQLLQRHELGVPLADYVHTIVSQSEHLGHLVADLLDFSSLQAGALPLRTVPYSPRALVERAVQALLPQAVGKGLRLHWQLDVPPQLSGDPHRITQVLSNLVSNAIKFTVSGDVNVRAWTTQGELVMTVDDSGPGLPPREVLFLPFRQGDGTGAGLHGGVGLGLAISQQLCQRMGGCLTAEDRPEGGARFRVQLPARPALDPSSALPGPEALFGTEASFGVPGPHFARDRPLEVLVIDDVDAARGFMCEALRVLGYEPHAASGADQGFALAERHRPELALVDIQMPHVDGWAAARGLRARLGKAPFLVALTADSVANDPERLRSAGFDSFAQKPLTVAALQGLLAQAHEHRGGVERQQPALDRDRINELRGLRTATGETLLGRTCKRVREALPPLLEHLRARPSHPATEDLRRTVHDLAGLFATVGATGAARAAQRVADEAAGDGVREESWRSLRAAAAAAERALGEIAALEDSARA